MKLKHEKSCGAIIFKRENGKILFLTVEYKKEKGYWGLVKGHVEKGETELETARREIYEEVGLKDLTFADGFRTEIIYNPYPNIEKLVVFFLAEAHSDHIQYLWNEHVDHQWLTIEAILPKLKYKLDGEVVSKAYAFLQAHPNATDDN